MTRVRIKGGYLNIGRRSPGHPDNELPGIEGPIDPDYGVDEGAGIDNELPIPPPGVWPPLHPSHPWVPVRPVDPGYGVPEGEGGEGGEQPSHPWVPPPGAIWPPLPPGANGLYWVLVIIPGIGWRYTVIDADARPDQGLPGGGERPSHPIAPGGRPPHIGGRPPQGGRPDQGLPDSGEHPENTPPGGAPTPTRSGVRRP